MKASELRAKNLEELALELDEVCQEQFKLTIQRATGQLAKPHLMHKARRNIARIKTLMHQKTQESAGKEQ